MSHYLGVGEKTFVSHIQRSNVAGHCPCLFCLQEMDWFSWLFQCCIRLSMRCVFCGSVGVPGFEAFKLRDSIGKDTCKQNRWERSVGFDMPPPGDHNEAAGEGQELNNASV